MGIWIRNVILDPDFGLQNFQDPDPSDPATLTEDSEQIWQPFNKYLGIVLQFFNFYIKHQNRFRIRKA
jgi:hypothetical protein